MTKLPPEAGSQTGREFSEVLVGHLLECFHRLAQFCS
jgi:hypothetical protein